MSAELLALLGSIVGGTGALLSYWVGWRARGSQRLPRGSYGNCVPLPPAPPYSSAAIAWHAEEAQRAIDTNARIRRTAELYARLVDPSLGEPWDEGHTQRGNGSGGPTTPKPGITPKPQPAGGRLINEGRLFGGYQSRPQQGTPNPPSSEA
jgi:hypothetical protein